MRIILKNTDGKLDAVFTMAVWAFAVCLVKVLIAGLSVEVGGTVYSAGEADAGVIAALLTPTLGAYVARRATSSGGGE